MKAYEKHGVFYLPSLLFLLFIRFLILLLNTCVTSELNLPIYLGVDIVFCPDKGKLRTVAGPTRTLNVNKFAESRASELESLHSIVKERLSNDFRCKRSKRRRTTGHDNRVAKGRVRKKQKLGDENLNKPDHLKNDKKMLPRHVRRRVELKKNSLNGFSTSGDGTKRLRTHLWYAKRFAMTKIWGFYLPLGVQGR